MSRRVPRPGEDFGPWHPPTGSGGGGPGSAVIRVDPPLSGMDVHRAAPDEPDEGEARLGDRLGGRLHDR